MRQARHLLEIFKKLSRIVIIGTQDSMKRKFYFHWQSLRRTFSLYSSFNIVNANNTQVLFAAATSFFFEKYTTLDEIVPSDKDINKEFDVLRKNLDDWEVVANEPNFRALRRKLKHSDIYEYKCAGTYYDISPKDFLDAQNDLVYRSEWDANVVSLELLSKQENHELIRWVAKFPYPMRAREYIYVRTTWISNDRKAVMVDSRAVPENEISSVPNAKNIRVTAYNSRMAIRSHGNWEDNGVDYVLTYSDDPGANVPRYVYNWFVNQGGPYFLKQVHTAAIQLRESGRKLDSVLEKFCRLSIINYVADDIYTFLEEDKEHNEVTSNVDEHPVEA